MAAISNTAQKRQGAALVKKLFAFALALALCVSFVPVAPAMAADDDAQENTVTLTIVNGDKTWVNKRYAFNEGDTVLDLLDAAVEEGDIKAYTAPESSYGGKYIGTITSEEGETPQAWNSADYSVSTYWSSYFNGKYGQGDCALDHVKLVAGDSYQFAWTCYTTVPASYDWTEFYASNTPEKAEGENVATLTIANGNTSLVNKEYAFEEGDTVLDLLDAAVAAGDIKSYTAPVSSYDGYKYIGEIVSEEGTTLAPANADDYSVSLYWSSFFDGAYGQGTCGLDYVKLEAGHQYQFGWMAYTTVPTSYDWDAYYEENVPGESTNTPAEPENPGTTPERPGTGNVATGIDENQIGELMDNIATSYAGTTDPWKVLALSALGMKDTIGSGFVAQAVKDIKNPPQDGNQATAVQRYIIALTAAGYDATALPDGDGTFNAIEKMAKNVTGNSNVNILLSTLWAYASGNYEVPDDANLSEQALVNKILDAQHADGGFAWSGSGTDVDTTAMAICALAPYEGEYEGVSEAINSALEALLAIQEEDGGFADNTGAENANSTAYAVLALCAAGVNPATEWATENGGTPLSALLQFAAKDLSGFVFDSSLNELNEMATEQGFMALVAYQGLLNSDGEAYNLYVDASKGISSIPDYTPQPKEEPKGDPDPSPADEGDEGAGDATQTGDSGVGALAFAAVIAMLATFIAGSAAHRRRMGTSNGRED